MSNLFRRLDDLYYRHPAVALLIMIPATISMVAVFYLLGAYPLPTVLALSAVAGIALTTTGLAGMRRAAAAQRAEEAKWDKYIESSLTDEALTWMLRTWKRRYDT